MNTETQGDRETKTDQRNSSLPDHSTAVYQVLYCFSLPYSICIFLPYGSFSSQLVMRNRSAINFQAESFGFRLKAKEIWIGFSSLPFGGLKFLWCIEKKEETKNENGKR
jgi:hypothetical protein